MSSAFGIAKTYNQFIPPVNLELMAQAMTLKQQNYDQGYQMIQSTIDFTKNIDLVKTEDKQYLNERITKLTNDLNSLGGVDLSSKGVQSAYKKYLNQALDDNVMNGIVSTQKYRSFQAEVQKIQEKQPDKYSAVNEMYALRPFMQYINDGKVGSKLGDMQYTPYKDVQEKYNKLVKEYVEKSGKKKFTSVDPNNPYQLIETEYSGIDDFKIKTMVEAMMSPEDRNQLQINGWYNMGMADEIKAQAVLDEHTKEKVSIYKGEIKNLRNKLSKETDKVKKKELEDDILALSKDMETYNDLPKKLTKGEDIGFYFERERLYNGLSQVYKKEISGIDLKENTTYTKQIDHSLKREEINLSVRKQNFEEKKYTAEAVDAANRGIYRADGETEFDKKTNLEIYEEGIGKLNKDISTFYTELDKAVDDPDLIAAAKELEDKGGVDYANTLLDYLKVKDLDKYAALKSQNDEIKASKTLIHNNMKNILDSHKKGLNMATKAAGYQTKLDKAQGYLPEENKKAADNELKKAYAYGYANTDKPEEKNYYYTLYSMLNGKSNINPEEDSEFIKTSESFKTSRPYNQDKKMSAFGALVTSVPLIGTIIENEFIQPSYTDEGKYNGAAPAAFENIKYNKEENNLAYSGALKSVYKGVLINNAYTIDPEEKSALPTYNKLYNAALGTAGAMELDRKKPIILQKHGDNFKIKQVITDKDGKNVPTEVGNISKERLLELNLPFDIAGNSLKMNTEYVPRITTLNGYKDFTTNPKESLKYGSNAAFVSKESVNKLIEDGLSVENKLYKDKLKDIVENTNQVSIKSSYNEDNPNDVWLEIYQKDNKLGEVRMDVATYNQSKINFYSTPEIYLTKLIQNSIENINNGIIPEYLK